ncbi:hypothetical protein [Pleomorphomonas carboxyditropha]|uniref:hypothetical protein n=1 Tax=Pleomorphomonas carboxyditropha TaxID=2023338 RepID=UPI000C1CBEE1|nr:hypothetical protein [Pleomorphomonas carboxyditropha]
MQKFVQGLVLALAVLLGGIHAEAATVAMTPEGLVDLSKFDELEKLFIVKVAENLLISSIDDHYDELLARKGGSLNLKKVAALSYAMLASEAKRVGLDTLAEIYGFKVKNFTDGIHGTADGKEIEDFDAKIETVKQQYFDSVMQRHANKKGTTVPPEEMQDIARRMEKDIFATAMEKVAGDN